MNKEGLEKSLKKFIKDNNIDFNGTGTNEDDFLESVSLDLALYAYNCDKNNFEVSRNDKDDVKMTNGEKINTNYKNLIDELKNTYHFKDETIEKFQKGFDLKMADDILDDYKKHPEKYDQGEKPKYKEYHFNESKNGYKRNSIFREADKRMEELYGDMMNKTLDEKVDELEAKQGKRALNHIKGDSYYKDEARLGLYKAYSKIKIAGYKVFWKAEKKVGSLAKGTTEKLKKRTDDLRKAKKDRVGHTGANLEDVNRKIKDLDTMVSNEMELVKKDNDAMLDGENLPQDVCEEYNNKKSDIRGDNGPDKQEQTYNELKSEAKRLKNRIDDLENTEHIKDYRDKIVELKKSFYRYQGLIDEYDLKELSSKVNELKTKTDKIKANVNSMDENNLSLNDKKDIMKFLNYGYLASDTLEGIINVYGADDKNNIEKGYKYLDKKDRKSVIKDINKVLKKNDDRSI